MIFYIASALQPYIFVFNVVHYLSFRCMASLVSSLVMSIIGGNWFLTAVAPHLRSKVRQWTPEAHQAKNNTPTMGGLIMIGSCLINVLLWCNLADPYVWTALVALLLFGIIGALDDINKVWYHKGISARAKFIAQIVSGLVTVFLLIISGLSTALTVPFFKDVNLDVGWLYLFWGLFIIVATSNAVNLTDGLDGLAASTLTPNFAIFGAICYLTGNALTSHYLHIPFIHCSELAVVSCTLVGGCLGFLWYNSYPAQMFMGDVGSLSMGAVLATIALVSKQEILLAIAGGLFVVETGSVILQVLSFKYTGKRLFKMAPLHHHFELLGWPEAKITIRFGIISLILCLFALITLKIR